MENLHTQINEQTIEQESQAEQEDNKKKKEKNRKWIFFLLLLILLLLFLLHSCSREKTPDIGGLELGVIDTDSLRTDADKERLQEALNQQVEAGMVSVFMETNVKVEKDGIANWLIQNVEQNHFSLQIDVKDSESGTIIYSSPVVKPGYKVETDVVSKTLETGTHPCLAEFSIIDPDTSETINRFELKINVTF